MLSRSSRQPFQVAGPTLLQEPAKGHLVGDDLFQWPRDEAPRISDDMDESPLDQRRDALVEVMSPKKHPQQLRRLLEQVGRDFKNVEQDEILGAIVAQIAGVVPLHGVVERVKIATVEGVNDRITKLRKKVAYVEGQLQGDLQEVERQRPKVLHLCPKNNDQIRKFISIPMHAVLRLVCVAERCVVIERDEVKAFLADALQNPFVNEQGVRIGNERQPRHTR